MKIAIDCHTLEIKDWAGKEKFLVALLNEYKKNQTDEFILYFCAKVFADNEFPDNFIPINKNLPSPLWQFYVLNDMRRRKADVLLSPCRYLMPAINFACDNVIVVHDLTTFLPITRTMHQLITRMREKLLLGQAIKNSHKVIAVSESTKNDCVKFFGTSPQKIEVVHLAASTLFTQSNPGSAEAVALASLGIPKDYVLSVGTLEPRKNLLGLLRAFKIIMEERPDLPENLVVVGKKGWYYKEIFDEVKRLQLEDRIVFTGYLPDEIMPSIYKSARCFVYPSFYEGFGLPVAEAMACGCPVITSNISSLPEVAGKAAIYVNPEDSVEIAMAIKAVLNDEALRHDLKSKGLEQARKFSWERTAGKILDIVKS